MFSMVSLGVGEIVGAIFMGILVEHINLKKCSYINTGLVWLATLVAIYVIKSNEYSWITFLMTFLWGFQDACISIHLDAILAFQFDSNYEPFAIDVMLEALFVFLCDLISSLFFSKPNWIVPYFIFIGIAGGVFQYFSSFF
jgi:hypothetical protein